MQKATTFNTDLGALAGPMPEPAPEPGIYVALTDGTTHHMPTPPGVTLELFVSRIGHGAAGGPGAFVETTGHALIALHHITRVWEVR